MVDAESMETIRKLLNQAVGPRCVIVSETNACEMGGMSTSTERQCLRVLKPRMHRVIGQKKKELTVEIHPSMAICQKRVE